MEVSTQICYLTLADRDVNAISRCPGFGLRSNFAIPVPRPFGVFHSLLDSSSHITCIWASSAVKMVTTLPDESPKR